MSTAAPTTMPATAPSNVKRFQNRLSMMAGPNAAPNTPQALDTRLMMEPASGSAAMSSATTAMASTTMRPAQSISLSLALSLRTTGLYTSLANAEAAARSWLSAVDMDAASTAESRMPEMMPGNRRRTMVMNTKELPLMASS